MRKRFKWVLRSSQSIYRVSMRPKESHFSLEKSQNSTTDGRSVKASEMRHFLLQRIINISIKLPSLARRNTSMMISTALMMRKKLSWKSRDTIGFFKLMKTSNSRFTRRRISSEEEDGRQRSDLGSSSPKRAIQHDPYIFFTFEAFHISKQKDHSFAIVALVNNHNSFLRQLYPLCSGYSVSHPDIHELEVVETIEDRIVNVHATADIQMC